MQIIMALAAAADAVTTARATTPTSNTNFDKLPQQLLHVKLLQLQQQQLFWSMSVVVVTVLLLLLVLLLLVVVVVVVVVVAVVVAAATVVMVVSSFVGVVAAAATAIKLHWLVQGSSDLPTEYAPKP